MNEPTFPYEAPHAYGAKPKKGLGRFAAIGCGGILVCSLLGVGTCALMVKEGVSVGEKEFGPPSDRYFAKVSAGDYRGAYGDFGTPMRASTTEEDYVALDRAIHDRLGRLESRKFQSVQAGLGPRGSWGRIVYSCKFENGPATVRMELQEENHQWKVDGFHYDSPLFDQSLRAALLRTAGDAGP
jgi:hypothetical protein